MASRTDKYSSSSGLNSGASSSSSSLSSSQRERIISNASGAKVQNSPTVTKSTPSVPSSGNKSSGGGSVSQTPSQPSKNQSTIDVSNNVSKTQVTTNTTPPAKAQTESEFAAENTKYLNTYGITKTQYDTLYQQWKSETDRYTPEYKEWVSKYGDADDRQKIANAEARASEASFVNWLDGKKELQEYWGTKDGAVGSVNMVGNSGVSQAYFDMYSDSTKYRTSSGSPSDLIINDEFGNQFYATDIDKDNYYDYVNSSNTKYISSQLNQYTYPGTLASAPTTEVPKTADYSVSPDTFSHSETPKSIWLSSELPASLSIDINSVSRYGVNPLNTGGLYGEDALNKAAETFSNSDDKVGLFIDTIDYTTSKGIQELTEGNVASGVIDTIAGVGTNILLPLDLVETIRKGIAGEDIKASDILTSAIDVVGLIPVVGWGVKGLVKGAKALAKGASKTADAVKAADAVVDAGKVGAKVGDAGDISKLDSAISKLSKASSVATVAGTLGVGGLNFTSGLLDGMGSEPDTPDKQNKGDPDEPDTPNNPDKPDNPDNPDKGDPGLGWEDIFPFLNWGGTSNGAGGGGGSGNIETVNNTFDFANVAKYILIGVVIIAVVLLITKGKTSTKKKVKA